MPYKDPEKRKKHAHEQYLKNKEKNKESRAAYAKERNSRPEIKAARAAYNATDKAKATRAAYQRDKADQHLKANQKYRENHPKKYKEMSKRNNRMRNGWTPEAFEKALVEQGNACAICGDPFTEVTVHADHEHTQPPKPRDLLCGLCNKGLGQFKDSSERLEAAALYLRRWGK